MKLSRIFMVLVLVLALTVLFAACQKAGQGDKAAPAVKDAKAPAPKAEEKKAEPPAATEKCEKKIHGQWTMSMPDNATDEEKMAAALLGAMVFEFDMDQMKMSMKFGDQGESIGIKVKECNDTQVVLLPAEIEKEADNEPMTIKVIGKDEIQILSKDDKPMTLKRKTADSPAPAMPVPPAAPAPAAE